MSPKHLSHPQRRVGLVERGEGTRVVQMRDSESRNAFTEPFVAELEEVLAHLQGDPEVRVIVLTGLPDVFASGAPRELLARLARGEAAPSDIRLSQAVLDLPVPVVAAMQGHATGGGFALGLCADIILMSRERRYGASFMNLGFTPGMGMTRLMEHITSPARAQELLYTGEYRRGADWATAGGVNYVLPQAEVLDKAFEVASRIAEKPRCSLELLKRTLSLPRRKTFEETYTLESMMHAITFLQPGIRDRIEGEYVE